MVLEFFEKTVFKVAEIFLIELKFIELEYHGKLEFPKLEYPKSGRFLHIFKTVVD